ncbi:MAG TPA: sigma 54-interacting transcriptional regulator [Bryobacteraceae bacterium]
MPFLSGTQRALLRAVSQLGYCNHFLPERLEFERAVLGSEFVEGEPVWSYRVEQPGPRENVWRIHGRLEPILEQLRERLADGAQATGHDLVLYEDAILHLLYTRYYRTFYDVGFGPARNDSGRWRFYTRFLADWRHFFEIDGVTFPSGHNPCHTFACFRQIQRAFEHVFRDIIGSSMAAARLRASVWQSIFTHDMRRYRRTLYARMGEFATLITGPSGTGKELAARAIAESRYAPFDPQRLAFANDNFESFFPINISALSPTLVESELFGHRRGSFTGAVADRKGWLETCPELGSVFLDELGDLDPAIQVKLLRVIETRTFHPVGETAGQRFRGKLITATNRDLTASMKKGQFREDLYYRLCSDQVTTPSLAEQLADSPGGLRELVLYMAQRVAGPEAEDLAHEVIEWTERNLGPEYDWPGNYRELEQCVKNVLIRRNYRPSRTAADDPVGEFREAAGAGRLTADELLSRYVTIVYSRTGNYEETARRLGLDRRTVKAKVDRALLKRLL